MIINREKFRFGVTDLLILAVSAVFAAGLRAWFGACPVGENVMTCHWAGEAEHSLAILLILLAALHLLLPDPGAKCGLSMAVLGLGVLIAVLPGHVIGLCAMPGMHCRSLMQPACIGFGTGAAVLAAADIIFWFRHHPDLQKPQEGMSGAR